MATFSVTANELKYASGSSWTSGKARQGVYSTTRYEGAINLAGLSGLDFSNITVAEPDVVLGMASSHESGMVYEAKVVPAAIVCVAEWLPNFHVTLCM